MTTTKSPKKKTDAAPISEARVFCKAGILAKRYGIHPKTIFRWADKKYIHRHKLNSRVCLFSQNEVENFILGCRVDNPGDNANTAA